ncbi:MAG: hypothetical protein WCI04_03850 [archaeon]
MNKNTNKKQNFTSIAIVAMAVLLFAGMVNASILGNATTDKKVLGENEVAFLLVTLMNDSNKELKNVNLRVQGDEGIVFYDTYGETTIFSKKIDSIKPGEVKEFGIKIKAVSIKNAKANLYAYFGTETELRQAAATMIETTTAPIEASGIQKIETINGIDTATIDFSLKNTSTKTIFNASAEALAPKDFIVKTQPVFEEKILSQGIMAQKFVITIPIEAAGEKKIVMAYGYFDDTNTPHYFENEYTFNVQKINYPIIALIGIIVLAIAAYLFFGKGNNTNIKGTDSKFEEDHKHGHKK